MNPSERYLVDRTGPPDPMVRTLERLLAVKRYRRRRPRPRLVSSGTLLAGTMAAVVLITVNAFGPASTEAPAAPRIVTPAAETAEAAEQGDLAVRETTPPPAVIDRPTDDPATIAPSSVAAAAPVAPVVMEVADEITTSTPGSTTPALLEQ